MNRPAPPPKQRPLGLSPVVAGTACCIVSALGYTAANICMRRLSVLDANEMWAVFNKELVAVVVVGPWLLARAIRRRGAWPSARVLGALAVVGLATQLGANLGVQWALKIVGLAIVIPAIFGVMLAASAVMGWAWLGERVSRRSAAAIALLLVALVLLGISAATVSRSPVDSQAAPSLWLAAAAVGAAGLGGGLYGLLTITIRHTVTGAASAGVVVFMVTGMGVLTLGPLSAWWLGLETLLRTPPEQFAWMLAAGAFNLVAFLAITKGLELTTVVHANVLNASQVAMAAIAGMMLFDERLNPWLALGVVLTIVGIFLIDRPDDGEPPVDQHA